MSSKPKVKAGSSSGHRVKELAVDAAKIKDKTRPVASSSNNKPGKKAEDDHKTRQPSTKPEASGSRHSKPPGNPDSDHPAVPTGQKKEVVVGKGKGPAIPNRGHSTTQKSSNIASPQIQSFNGTSESLQRHLSQEESKTSIFGGYSGNSDGGSRGGPFGGGNRDGGGGGDDPNENEEEVLVGCRPYRIKNKDGRACIMSDSGLPIELRQRIYSFFLDHREVKYDPNNAPPGIRQHSSTYFEPECLGRAHAYNFSLGLLRTNKATREDAKAYFDKMNKLVLVSFNMPAFTTHLHHFDAPIITDEPDRLRICDVHAVRFNIEFPIPPLLENQGTPIVEDGGQPFSKPEKGRLLMVSADFDKLCLMMKFVCSWCIPPAVYVKTGPGQPVDLVAVTYDHTPRLTLDFTRQNVLDHNQRETLTNQLKQITGGGYGLKITSVYPNDPFATTTYVKILKSFMAPPLIWSHSLYKDRTEALTERRARYVKEYGNDISRLSWRYLLLMSYLKFKMQEDWKIFPIIGEYDKSDEKHYRLAMHRLAPLIFYLRLEMSALFLRKRFFNEDSAVVARRTLEYLEKFFWNTPNAMKLQYHHMSLFCFLAENAALPFNEITPTVASLIRDMQSLGDLYPKAVADLKILTPLLDAPEVSSITIKAEQG